MSGMSGMSGYVCNDSGPPVFVAQRGVPQGRKVSFDDLLLVFSKKSLFEEVGPGFVLWLKGNVFSDDRWGFYNADGTPYVFSVEGPVELHSVSVVEEPMVETPVAEEKKPVKKKRAPRKPKANKETASVTPPKNPGAGAGRKMRRDANSLKGVKVTASMIIEADYEEARDLINKCKERPVLKKALALSQHFSGKEAHMRHLIKRVEEVNI
jgi:hypothetical protein